jgi:nitrogen fixation/metabolism regulation signal transduction histidine kinase
VLILLTFLIILQSSNLWRSFAVETASDTLLLYALSSLNFIAFVIFGFIFLRSIIKLIRERRALQLGSRIKTRLLLYFAAVSLLPIIAMAGFSYLFMNRAIERWFAQIPENVVREAREVQDRSSEVHAAKLQETAAMLASALDGRELGRDELDRLANDGNLQRIEIVSRDNELLSSTERPFEPGGAAEIALIRQAKFDDPTLKDGLGVDAVAATMPDGRRIVLSPNLQSTESVSQLVDRSLAEFDRLKDQQLTVRQVGLLTLGVLTFLLIFASSWTAFYIARGLTVPIKALAEGADEIAQGNYGHRVEVFAEDELALLVESFNGMSVKLEENSNELQTRQKYIETVLQALPTGVISLDANNNVTTINIAAIRMLKLEKVDRTSLGVADLVDDETKPVLERIVARSRRVGHASEQTTFRMRSGENGDEGGVMPVALTAVALTPPEGVVLVLEDLSELIAAQRASAWQEVARRMAHEIKNPLTPIQLSAERIAKRFDGESRGNGESANAADKPVNASEQQTARVIRDGTETIIREVQSLKSMVDEFSRYARLPDARLEPGDLRSTIEQVIALYQDRLDGARINAKLGESLPESLVDEAQIKRVFVNLIDNAIEAFDEEQTEKLVTIAARHDTARDIIVIEIFDNGRGIDPADYQNLFQPYFSTKGRGTGLGLPIVQRIITEHHGRIKVVANHPRGARFIIELPTVER